MPREFVHGMYELGIARTLRNLAAGEHALLGVNHNVGREFGGLAEQAGIVHEAGHVGSNIAIHHAARADGFASENASVNGRFGVVAHNAAEELHAGNHGLAAIFHLHDSIAVFEIAVTGAGTEVDPLDLVAEVLDQRMR